MKDGQLAKQNGWKCSSLAKWAECWTLASVPNSWWWRASLAEVPGRYWCNLVSFCGCAKRRCLGSQETIHRKFALEISGVPYPQRRFDCTAFGWRYSLPLSEKGHWWLPSSSCQFSFWWIWNERYSAGGLGARIHSFFWGNYWCNGGTWRASNVYHCIWQPTASCLGTCHGQSFPEQLSWTVEICSCLSSTFIFCVLGPASHVVCRWKYTIQSGHGDRWVAAIATFWLQIRGFAFWNPGWLHWCGWAMETRSPKNLGFGILFFIASRTTGRKPGGRSLQMCQESQCCSFTFSAQWNWFA